MKPTRYTGCEARIECGDEDGGFGGRLAGIQDVPGFLGVRVDEMRAAFHQAVDVDCQSGALRSPNSAACG